MRCTLKAPEEEAVTVAADAPAAEKDKLELEAEKVRVRQRPSKIFSAVIKNFPTELRATETE